MSRWKHGSEWTVVTCLLFSVVTAGWAEAADLTSADVQLVAPESVGFSSERLKRLSAVMEQAVMNKEYPGVVTLLARHGKVVYFEAVGKRDLASGAPVEKDTIFRIFSTTKPVTAAAMMVLYEEGKWNPQDPLYKFIPQFAGLKVYKGTDSGGNVLLEDVAHPPTLRELMTHTAGFSYGNGLGPVDKGYWDERGRYIFRTGSLQAMIDKLAQTPLLFQPSSRWMYGLSMDIEGYIIEQLSRMTLPQFMKKRLFEPIGMTDTGFYVPQGKRDRFATLYKMSDQGELVPTEYSKYGYEFEEEPALPMGGGGLVSTARDYFRFAQMLLNGGEIDGVRILGPETVKLMMSNHLADSLMTQYVGYSGSALLQPRPGLGYGFNGAVVTDPGLADMPMGKGTYLWDGAAGTWFWIDPTYDIVFVGMVQRLLWFQPVGSKASLNLEELSRAVTYQALVRPDK